MDPLVMGLLGGSIGSVGGSVLGGIIGGDGGAKRAAAENRRRFDTSVRLMQAQGARNARAYHQSRRLLTSAYENLTGDLERAQGAASGIFRQARKDILDQGAASDNNAMAMFARNGVVNSSQINRARRGNMNATADQLGRLGSSEASFFSNLMTQNAALRANALGNIAGTYEREAGAMGQSTAGLANTMLSAQEVAPGNPWTQSLGQLGGLLGTVLGSGMGGSLAPGRGGGGGSMSGSAMDQGLWANQRGGADIGNGMNYNLFGGFRSN